MELMKATHNQTLVDHPNLIFAVVPMTKRQAPNALGYLTFD